MAHTTEQSEPPKRRNRYITPQGEQALREELRYLWKEKRPEVTQAVREAAAQGDRSENAEGLRQETAAGN